MSAPAHMGPVVEVRVEEVAGSAPREVGAAMWVWEDAQAGSIGGGRLEFEAARGARAGLAAGQTAWRERLALGPGLGQCCGGAVTLAYLRRDGVPAAVPRDEIWIWGAGHVGAALCAVLGPWPGARTRVIDNRHAMLDALPRITGPAANGADAVYAAEPDALAAHAPPGAWHLVMTHDHALDLSLCHALLGREPAYLGLIGSATKRARFLRRLAGLGHRPSARARLTCPIGTPALGKHPQAIAIGVAADLIAQLSAAEAGRAKAIEPAPGPAAEARA